MEYLIVCVLISRTEYLVRHGRLLKCIYYYLNFRSSVYSVYNFLSSSMMIISHFYTFLGAFEVVFFGCIDNCYLSMDFLIYLYVFMQLLIRYVFGPRDTLWYDYAWFYLLCVRLLMMDYI